MLDIKLPTSFIDLEQDDDDDDDDKNNNPGPWEGIDWG